MQMVRRPAFAPFVPSGLQPPVRDLQSWPGHAGPLRRRSDYSLWYQRREPVQRAHDFANDVGGHLGVARRGVELGMPEQPRAIMRTFYVTET